jgi:hypothetical protein
MKYIYKILFIFVLFSAMSYSQRSYGSELAATVAIPTGYNSQYYKVGYGAIGGFYYEMESDWRFGLGLGFIRLGVDGDEVNKQFQTLGQPGTVDITGSVSVIPILLSCKYMFPGESTRFYGIIEAGLYEYWTKATGTIMYTNGDTAPVDKSEFNSEVGFDLGIGALFPIDYDLSIDASFRYHFVRNEGTVKVNYYTGEESVGSSHFLNFGLGLNWNFDL